MRHEKMIDQTAVETWLRSRLNSSDRVAAERSAELSDESIVAAILKTRIPAPFGLIVARYRSKLTALATTVLSGTSAAAEVDDVVQDAFVSAYDHLTSFRSGAAFRPWLYKITLNQCTDRLRRSKAVHTSTALDLLPARSLGPLEIAIGNEEANRINNAIALLPIDARAMFLLRHMDNLSYAELAVAMGVSESVVKVRLFRARARLKELLKEEER